MKFAGKLNLVAGAALLLAAVSVRAEEAQPAAVNPYSTITARNVFALVPIPTNPPVDTTPPDPPIKLTPNGIMNVFGQLEVIFKAAVPAKGKEAAHDQSYVMAEGEREDDIEVVKIDDKASMITFINHGIKQDLPLADAPSVTTAAPSPGIPGGGVPMPANRPGPSGFPNRLMHTEFPPGSPAAAARARALAAVGTTDSGQASLSVPSGETSGTSGQNQNTPELTPEEKTVIMEAQRAKWMDEGNPAAVIIPPTTLTKQLTGEDQSPGGPSAPAP